MSNPSKNFEYTLIVYSIVLHKLKQNFEQAMQLVSLNRKAEEDAYNTRTIEREIELLKLEIDLDDIRKNSGDPTEQRMSEMKSYLSVQPVTDKDLKECYDACKDPKELASTLEKLNSRFRKQIEDLQRDLQEKKKEKFSK